ncbi:MAG: hypothetical protein HYT11_00245 [Candidatus Levybacteria bacterium]|nr:hypothetical protein [Candidatus Levybacteria bacterium]
MNKKVFCKGQSLVQQGQSLVEVLLGFAIASVVITAMSITVIGSLNNAQRSRSQNTATQYAQQALESMRQFHNNDIDTFRTFGGIDVAKSYCFASSCAKLSSVSGDPCGEKITSSCGDNLTGIVGFTREVSVTRSSTACFPKAGEPTPTPQNYIRVEAFVRWTDGQCSGANPYCHETRLTTCMN